MNLLFIGPDLAMLVAALAVLVAKVAVSFLAKVFAMFRNLFL